jgi:hypothetical protein
MARFSSSSSGGEGTVGPAGPEGPAGSNGTNGTNGADGADGADALWNFTGEYSGGAAYAVGDIATYDGQLWYRINSNGGNVGDTPSPGLWNLLAAKGTDGADGADGSDGSPGLVYLGNYVSGNGYIANVAVVKGSDNNLYIATSSGGLGNPVGNTAEWAIFLPKGADGADADLDTGTTTINSYNPVWSGTGLDINPTAPVPPATGSYIKIGNFVQVQIEVDFAEVLDFGTGQYSITLPLPSLYHTDVYGGSVHDTAATVTHYSLKAHLSSGSSTATLWSLSGSSQDQPFNHNAPINLTTNDKFHMSFSYIADLT